MTEGEAQTISNIVDSGDGGEYSHARKDTRHSLLGEQVLEHTVLSRQLSVHRRKTSGISRYCLLLVVNRGSRL